MKILIIEDEEATARKLQRLLADVEPTATVVGQLGSVEESVAWLRTHDTSHPSAPDLILMDIELADGQSFEIFKQVDVNCPVIFTTAYDEFALKAFKVNSIDYLLKPIKETDLRGALTKLHSLKEVLTDKPNSVQTSLVNLLQQLAEQSVTGQFSAQLPFRNNSSERRSERDRFLVKQGQRLFSVPIHEVSYFFSRNKMTFLKSNDGHEWLIEYTMDELEHMLDSQRFFRLNRQVIAELQAIGQVNIYFNGKLKIALQPAFSEEVLVSREKAGEFKRWLGE
ncbi:response regulator transcription factor [Spirosoma sp. BT702]|uniref:Response regulator transcription factor n=1 Tax=Spirosoma profusum TaxID=2771354 RepID=A0A926Y352_9BACT|nr:LytTR family DNA-binding domain-containing protein [Spirosoma profusum]MBD2703083.1 response regulator transcription factor [Spirosoma profusum]